MMMFVFQNNLLMKILTCMIVAAVTFTCTPSSTAMEHEPNSNTANTYVWKCPKWLAWFCKPKTN